MDNQMLMIVMLKEFQSKKPLLILFVSSVSSDILEIALHYQGDIILRGRISIDGRTAPI